MNWRRRRRAAIQATRRVSGERSRRLLPLAKRGRPAANHRFGCGDGCDPLHSRARATSRRLAEAFPKRCPRGGACRRQGLPAGLDGLRAISTAWRDTGLWQSINHPLVMSARELEGREASLYRRGATDSQSVNPTESGGAHGALMRAEGIKGRARRDHDRYAGRLRCSPSSIRLPDGDGSRRASRPSPGPSPPFPRRWRHVFADGGYAGDNLKAALRGPWRLDHRDHPNDRHRQGLRRLAASMGRRTDFLAWLSAGCRRLANDGRNPRNWKHDPSQHARSQAQAHDPATARYATSS